MGAWPEGIRAAVSLSYDGALPCHVETVLPQLEAAGFRGTFYGDGVGLLARAREWRSAADRGHEIGNGALLSAACPDGSLPGWTLAMIEEDLELTHALLNEMFGSWDHSVAFPCGVPRCNCNEDYREVVHAQGWVARGGQDGLNNPRSCDLGYLARIVADELTGCELAGLVETAAAKGAWLILAFHGVGVGDLAVDSAAHLELLQTLRSRDDLWVDPIAAIAARLRFVNRRAALA